MFRKVNSVFQRRSYNELKSFKWEKLIPELQSHAPVLLSVLYACTSSQKGSNRVPVIGMCCATMLNLRSNQMSLDQKVIATVLQAGHCSKQVSNIFCNKLITDYYRFMKGIIGL